MGYGGAPPWVYKREMASRDMSHSDQERRHSSEIEDLKKENQKLKDRIEALEAENKDLKKYIDSLNADPSLKDCH